MKELLTFNPGEKMQGIFMSYKEVYLKELLDQHLEGKLSI
jgi:hypothetical protein